MVGELVVEDLVDGLLVDVVVGLDAGEPPHEARATASPATAPARARAERAVRRDGAAIGPG
jgi:hypothetical protein